MANIFFFFFFKSNYHSDFREELWFILSRCFPSSQAKKAVVKELLPPTKKQISFYRRERTIALSSIVKFTSSIKSNFSTTLVSIDSSYLLATCVDVYFEKPVFPGEVWCLLCIQWMLRIVRVEKKFFSLTLLGSLVVFEN